jgi:hypothetical protein
MQQLTINISAHHMRFIFAIVLILFINVIFAQRTFGANTVTATVTPQKIEVTVTPGTVTYGPLTLSTSRTTLNSGGGTNELQTAQNTGNIAEDFTIDSSSAVGGATPWTISDTAINTNVYMHAFSLNSGGAWTQMTGTPTSLATNVAVSGTQTFDLKIDVPSATAVYDAKTITVTVTASAH